MAVISIVKDRKHCITQIMVRHGCPVVQIIDMGLAEDSACVLGAALVWHGGQEWLLVLLSHQLLIHKIAIT